MPQRKRPAPETQYQPVLRNERKTIIVRFRVTPEEFETIRSAACLCAGDLEQELAQRGFPDVFLAPIRRPSEWARFVVLDAAKKRQAEYHAQVAEFLKTTEGKKIRKRSKEMDELEAKAEKAKQEK